MSCTFTSRHALHPQANCQTFLPGSGPRCQITILDVKPAKRRQANKRRFFANNPPGDICVTRDVHLPKYVGDRYTVSLHAWHAQRGLLKGIHVRSLSTTIELPPLPESMSCTRLPHRRRFHWAKYYLKRNFSLNRARTKGLHNVTTPKGPFRRHLKAFIARRRFLPA